MRKLTKELEEEMSDFWTDEGLDWVVVKTDEGRVTIETSDGERFAIIEDYSVFELVVERMIEEGIEVVKATPIQD
jgi:hypothetical protein